MHFYCNWKTLFTCDCGRQLVWEPCVSEKCPLGRYLKSGLDPKLRVFEKQSNCGCGRKWHKMPFRDAHNTWIMDKRLMCFQTRGKWYGTYRLLKVDKIVQLHRHRQKLLGS